MFEKEAEEYNQKVPFNPLSVEKEIRRAFQKGAEFGYNKAIVEIKDAYEGNGNFSAWFESYLEGKNV